MSGSRAWRIAGAAAMAVLAAIPLGCSRGEAAPSRSRSGEAAQPAKKAEAVKVATAPVEFRELRQTVEVVGTIRGWEELAIGAKHGGRVIKVRRDMGDHVKPGDPLADLETIDAELNVQQAQRKLDADLAELGLAQMPDQYFDPQKLPSVVKGKVALERADIVLKRERSLNSRGVGNPEQLQFAVNDREGRAAELSDSILKANALVARCRADYTALQTAKQALSEMTVVTPTPTETPDGGKLEDLKYAVRKRSVTEGQMIANGETVYELVIEDPLRLWASVPSIYEPKIKVGQEAELRVIAYPDQTFPARVARISPATDPLTRAFQVELAVPNPDRKLKPGDFAKVSVITGVTDNAAIVPVESIMRFAGITKLFLADGGIAREIKLARALAVEKAPNKAEAQTLDGKPIPQGAQVIVTGQKLLADGDAVTIRPPHQFSEQPAPAKASRPSAE